MTTMTMSGRKPLVSFLRLSLLVWFGINIIISSCISAAAASSASGSTRAASHLRSAAAVADKAQPNQAAAAAAATTTGGRNLVIGGSDATQNRYPSYVALVNDQYTVGCGGTLIAPDVVLTAAHCSRSNLKYALVGKYFYAANMTTDGYEQIEILNPVSEMDYSITDPLEAAGLAIIDPAGFIHPRHSWTGVAGTTPVYDVMLLKLANPSSHPVMRVNFDPNVPVERDTGNEIVVVGLGRTEVSGPLADVLQQVYLNYVPYDECIDAAAYNVDYKFELSPDMICTDGVGPYTVRGQCYGDSGGPYIVWGDTPADDVQVGVASWAVNCASRDFPMVGSRTSASADFIRGVTCAISSSPPNDLCTAVVATPNVPQHTSVTDGVAVSVRIFSDPFPYEISWKITDSTGQLVYMSVDYGSNEGDHSFTEVMLPPGQAFIFVIQDAADDGIFGDPDAVLYEVVLVDQGVNMVLVEGNGIFTTSQTHPFSVPLRADYPAPAAALDSSGPIVDTSLLAGVATTTVLIDIRFADYHEDLSWTVTDAAGVVYASVPPDHYRFGEQVRETIVLPPGTFVLTLSDRRGTDDFRALESFAVSYVDAGGWVVPLVQGQAAVSGESTTGIFEILPSNALPEEEGRVTICAASSAECIKSTDCCSGRCFYGICRATASMARSRESLRIGVPSAGGVITSREGK